MLRPTAIEVIPEKNYHLKIKFDNMEEKIFDVAPYIVSVKIRLVSKYNVRYTIQMYTIHLYSVNLYNLLKKRLQITIYNVSSVYS